MTDAARQNSAVRRSVGMRNAEEIENFKLDPSPTPIGHQQACSDDYYEISTRASQNGIRAIAHRP
jgi:hypothetical protein